MLKKKWPSIRCTFIIVVCAALFPALLIIVWSGFEFSAQMKKYLYQIVLQQVEAFAQTQQRITNGTQQILGTLASLPEFQERMDQKSQVILKSVHSHYPEYLNFTLTDAEGIIRASSRLESGIDLSDRPHIKRILETHRFSTGEYMLGLVEQTPSFAYVYPVFNSQRIFVGSLNGIFKLSSYVDIYKQYHLPFNSFLDLVDRNGRRVFFYPPKETNPIGGKIKASSWQKMVAGPEQGSFIEPNSDGVERLTAYKKLRLQEDQAPYLYVVFATPLAPLITASRNVILRSVLILVLISLGALITTLFLYQRLFGRRFRILVETTEKIRQGDLSARVAAEDRSADLGTIAQALNLMAQELQVRSEQEGADKRRIAQALGEKEILLKEVHHRVKNNLQLILSMVRLQADTGADTAQFREALEGRIGSMALIHEMLYQTENSARMDLQEYLQQLTNLLLQYSDNAKKIRLEQQTERVFVVLDQAIPFGLLVNELVTNALKHGFTQEKEAVLRVYLGRRGPSIHLEVEDNGTGLPSGFDPNAARGIGLQIAQALATQLGGPLQWASAEGGGSRFWVDFPWRETL